MNCGPQMNGGNGLDVAPVVGPGGNRVTWLGNNVILSSVNHHIPSTPLTAA